MEIKIRVPPRPAQAHKYEYFISQSMALSLVSVNKQEFDAAKPGGYVYGYAQYGTAKAPVYVDLGQEKEYYRSRNDDPSTSYRLFAHSTIYYAKTDEELDAQQYSAVLKDQTVKIFS